MTIKLKRKEIKERVFFVNSLNDVLDKFETDSVVLFIAENVYQLNKHLFVDYRFVIIKSGENQKKLKTVEGLISKLLRMGLDRNAMIVGVGGGCVTDITGLTASLFMRGVKFGFFPTTLLAMCDASIGGKNGVNLGKVKNVIGTIKQPDFVAIIPHFLNTLPDKEFRSGLGEVIKHAVIKDISYFNYLEANTQKIILRDKAVLESIILQSIEIKSKIVEQDELEKYQRQLLNFGHTFAHAIEIDSGYTHGECVTIGIYIDFLISYKLNLIKDEELNRLKSILIAFKLPFIINFKTNTIIKSIISDKKRKGEHIDYILPHKIGSCRIHSLSINFLREIYSHIEAKHDR